MAAILRIQSSDILTYLPTCAKAGAGRLDGLVGKATVLKKGKLSFLPSGAGFDPDLVPFLFSLFHSGVQLPSHDILGSL